MDEWTNEGDSKGPSTDGGDTKKLESFDVPVGRKDEKPHSFVILRGVKGLEEIKNFFENPFGTFLSPIHVLSNCQVSEKSNEQFPR